MTLHDHVSLAAIVEANVPTIRVTPAIAFLETTPIRGDVLITRAVLEAVAGVAPSILPFIAVAVAIVASIVTSSFTQTISITIVVADASYVVSIVGSILA